MRRLPFGQSDADIELRLAEIDRLGLGVDIGDVDQRVTLPKSLDPIRSSWLNTCCAARRDQFPKPDAP
jgi:hypothetical protein